MRNYDLMRRLMIYINTIHDSVDVSYLVDLGNWNSISKELTRLQAEGLIDATLQTNQFRQVLSGELTGLTSLGVEFLRIIENPRVWCLISDTLEASEVDLSYPLLLEICTEVIKRFVINHIPKIC